MKKNRLMRLACLLIVLTLMTSCFVGGTFAKYTSTSTATDSARVAKWSFKIGTTDVAATNTFTFDVFSTINDESGTGDDAQVKDGSGDERIIAPGTTGSFEITLENTSEVDARYAIDFTVTNDKSIPLWFSLDNGSSYVKWNDIDSKDIAMGTEGVLNYAGGTTTTDTVKVMWKWAFTDDSDFQKDATDTELGLDGTASVEFKATVTVEQVD